MNLIFVILFSVLFFSHYATAQKHVAITQIVSHPALNAVKESAISTLKQCPLGPELQIGTTDANGSLTVASQIAQQLVSENPDVVVAISTPSAQTVVKAFRGKTPVVFAAVTDPIHANLITPQHPGKNLVTGVTDLSPFAEQLKFILELLPNLRTLGIIYNAGEDNSRAGVEMMRKAAAHMGITIRESSVSKAFEVPQVTASLVKHVDAIYIPNDNLLASSIESVIKVAHSRKVPVFAADILLVERGALAMRGISYNDIGEQVGKMVCELLKGKGVEEIPVEHPQRMSVYLNLISAKVLGITFSDQLMSSADRIIGKKPCATKGEKDDGSKRKE